VGQIDDQNRVFGVLDRLPVHDEEEGAEGTALDKVHQLTEILAGDRRIIPVPDVSAEAILVRRLDSPAYTLPDRLI
jgi:hypothetical protein